MSCNFIQDNRLWSELEWRFLTSVVYVLLTKKCYQIIPCLSILVKLRLECPVLISVVQSLSCVRLFATPWTAARQASLSITNSWSLLKLVAIESVMPSNHLILCRPLLLLPSFFPSIRVFSNELILQVRWPECWSFSPGRQSWAQTLEMWLRGKRELNSEASAPFSQWLGQCRRPLSPGTCRVDPGGLGKSCAKGTLMLEDGWTDESSVHENRQD